MVHSSVLYISGRRRGPPNVAGPGVAPYPILSTGLFSCESPGNVYETLYAISSSIDGYKVLYVTNINELYIY